MESLERFSNKGPSLTDGVDREGGLSAVRRMPAHKYELARRRSRRSLKPLIDTVQVDHVVLHLPHIDRRSCGAAQKLPAVLDAHCREDWSINIIDRPFLERIGASTSSIDPF
jgi:hypothetical protein